MKSCTLFLLAVLAACGDDGGASTVDAGPRADAPPSCPPQTAPFAAGAHELFIAFDGVTITLGDCDDSKIELLVAGRAELDPGACIPHERDQPADATHGDLRHGAGRAGSILRRRRHHAADHG